VIISPITSRWAQWSYDEVSEKGLGQKGNAPLAHLGIQLGNIVAHTFLPIQLTRMANPNVMSYAYKGLDPVKFGMKAAMTSRKEFQIASSPAYRIGAKIGGATPAMAKGARIGGRIGTKLIPGLGWAMLAYDGYDLVANRRLFGVKL